MAKNNNVSIRYENSYGDREIYTYDVDREFFSKAEEGEAMTYKIEESELPSWVREEFRVLLKDIEVEI